MHTESPIEVIKALWSVQTTERLPPPHSILSILSFLFPGVPLCTWYNFHSIVCQSQFEIIAFKSEILIRGILHLSEQMEKLVGKWHLLMAPKC